MDEDEERGRLSDRRTSDEGEEQQILQYIHDDAGGQDKDGSGTGTLDAGRNIDFPESVFPSFFSLSLSLSFFRNNRFSNWCNEPELYTLHCTTRSLLIRFCLRELAKRAREGNATRIKSESFALNPRSVGRVDHHRSETQHRQRRRRRRHRLSSLPLNLSVHK